MTGRQGYGGTRARVARLIVEDPGLSDEAIASQLGISEAAVSAVRRAVGIPTQRERFQRAYRVTGGLYRCRANHRFLFSPKLPPSLVCRECGGVAYLRSLRVRPK